MNEKSYDKLAIAELSTLYEISSILFLRSKDEILKEALEKVIRLFGVRYFLLFDGKSDDGQIVSSWGFKGSEDFLLKINQKEPNQFNFSFTKLGNLELFMEQSYPIKTRERRLYIMFARSLENSLLNAKNIEKREKAEKTLQKSEKKFRDLVENINDVIFTINPEGYITYISPTIEQITSYKTNELIGQNFTIFVHPNDISDLFDSLKNTLAGKLKPTEFRVLDKDGTVLYIRTSSRPIIKQSQTIGVTGVISDVTERIKFEKALKKSEIKYRTIFEHTGTATAIIDEDTTLSLVNAEFEILSGYSKEELENNKSWTEFVAEDDLERMKNYHALRRTKASIAPLNYEFQFIDRNKNIKNVLITVVLFPDSQKSLASLIDITDRKKAELKIKEQFNFLQHLIDSINLPIFYKDINGVYDGCNQAFEEYLGLQKENIIGKTVYDIAPKELADKYYQMDNDLFQKLGFQVDEAPVKYADGTTHFVVFNKTTYNDTTGNLAGLIGIMVDISERKQSEDKIKKALEEKEMLLKEIHHRVKNNLMVISSLLNIQSKYIKDKEALGIFKESQNRAKSMALIHERLYRSSDLKRINFGDYIRTLSIDLFHTYIIDPSLIKLNMDVDDLMVDINTTVPLGLIVNELITNSMKHAFPDGRNGEITIGFHKNNDEFILSVKDNGIGFPEGLDFRQTKSLGLQLVNSLTEQIDGEIELNKTNGTCFKIIFKEIEY
ncbi:MAG: PAS domain S-box protein [Methanobacteriaceae archaeon]|jgi:PAS domain S-box-containing protein|nr:PAS domain S-box protein [Methanobacteriaceae archaeon]MDO9626159.1 PAS domain S-box protein [Methanobacteriaceae archaeon]